LTIKPILIGIFITAAGASYFMDSFNIVIDTAMIQSAVETTSAETRDLLTFKLVGYLVLLGFLPAYLINKLKLEELSFKSAVFSKAKLFGSSALVIVLITLGFSSHYTTFFREHKELRYYANPLTFIYSSGKYVSEALAVQSSGPRTIIGEDARIPDWDDGRELIILVVGETARSDHFGLNGYPKNTSPRLESKNIISFDHMWSCGTATAISLPCMFSLAEARDFDVSDVRTTENFLDVLLHSGVSLLWRDNNTGAKGLIADEYFENFADPAINPVCDSECRDIGMLENLDNFIKNAKGQDIVIVLHQMGNHGPAYYKRYPADFEVFSPSCQTSQLEQCSDDEINNAYDNALLYTDYFLAAVIEFLEPYGDDFETAMLYVSDHGESLGENGLYLHGLPNFMAPDTQRNVPAILWLGDSYDMNLAEIAAQKHSLLSHDNYFHTVLGLMEIETEVYDQDKDILRGIFFDRGE
jgi:lipid A ethanolaminephosphotransferase